MKNENGLSFLGVFFVIIFIIFIITFAIKYGFQKFNSVKCNDIKSNMLLINGACKVISDEATVNKNTDNYIGTALTQYKSQGSQKNAADQQNQDSEKETQTDASQDNKEQAQTDANQENKEQAQTDASQENKEQAQTDASQDNKEQAQTDANQDNKEQASTDASQNNKEQTAVDDGKIDDPIIKEFLNKNIIPEEEYKNYYVLTDDDLKRLDVDVKNEENAYYLVNYTSDEVIITSGLNGKYKLSEIEQN